MVLQPPLAERHPVSAAVAAGRQAGLSPAYSWRARSVVELSPHKACSAHAGPHTGTTPTSGRLPRHTDRVYRIAVFLAPHCPARGHRRNGAPGVTMRLRRRLTRRPLPGVMAAGRKMVKTSCSPIDKMLSKQRQGAFRCRCAATGHGDRAGAARRQRPDGQPVRYRPRCQGRQDCALNSPPGQ